MKVTPKVLNYLLSMTERELGYNYLLPSDFEQAQVSMHLDGKRLLGYCITRTFTPNELRKHLNMVKSCFPFYINHAYNVSLMNVVVVTKDRQYGAYARKLIENSLGDLHQLKMEAVCAVTKKTVKNNSVYLSDAYDKSGFVQVKTFADYWRDNLDFKCNTCGKKSCTCQAVLYCKPLIK